MAARQAHVWLLFYDLYHRSFKKRDTKSTAISEKLFLDAGLNVTENALCSLTIKLAASISRLRIEYNALSLSDLLPRHLRDEKVAAQSTKDTVTCWVNTKKIT